MKDFSILGSETEKKIAELLGKDSYPGNKKIEIVKIFASIFAAPPKIKKHSCCCFGVKDHENEVKRFLELLHKLAAKEIQTIDELHHFVFKNPLRRAITFFKPLSLLSLQFKLVKTIAKDPVLFKFAVLVAKIIVAALKINMKLIGFALKLHHWLHEFDVNSTYTPCREKHLIRA